MRVPNALGAYGVTLVLGLFGASGLVQQCTPPPPPPPPPPSVPIDNCVTLVNQERTSRGIAALTVDNRLATAAQDHSAYQAQTSTMSHTGSGGTNAGQRITAAGYQWSWWAENVAAGQPDCASVVGAWMASQGHRENILNGNLKNIGVGSAASGNGTVYWTMNFGSPR